MKKHMHLVLLGVLMLLSACASQSLDDYDSTTPTVDLKAYFTGPIKAWGIIQEPSGKVVSKFDVTMHGSWKDNVGTLKEEFTFYDGSKQERIWTITRQADGKYEGTASDVIDKAVGETRGNAIRWAYEMNVPVKGDTYRIKFDDWMWQMHDGVMINRSYLKKFGFTVAELTLFMKKQ